MAVRSIAKVSRNRGALLCALSWLGAAHSGCNAADRGEFVHGTNGDVGAIGLQLEISDGVFVDEVSFQITGNDIVPIVGTIPVESVGSTVSALIGGIAAGLGYEVVLTAVTRDRSADCVGSAMFDVTAGQTTEVSVVLDCTEVTDDGIVRVDGNFNTCPDIVRFSAFPLQVPVGSEILLAALAVDRDGDVISYDWSAAPLGGEFTEGSAAETSYRCETAGDFLLTVVAEDERCADTSVVNVTCAPVGVCGNGQLELGERCDDGNLLPGDGCSETCREEVCGNGVVDPGEQCDAGELGSASCRGAEPSDGGQPCTSILPPSCGNSVIDASEECDDGNPDSADGCSANCLLEACGNSRIDVVPFSEPLEDEQCDDGNRINGDGCDDACRIEIDACTRCTLDSTGPDGGRERFEACDTQECQNLLACINETRCAEVASIDCYCGPGVSPFQCLIPGNQQGACVDAIEVAAGADDPQAIAERFINPEFPLGDAFRIIEFQRVHCAVECEAGFALQLIHASDGEAGAEAVQDAPRFSAVLEALRNTMAESTLTLLSGDNWIPGPFYSAGADASLDELVGITRSGRPDIAMFNAMGVQASCLGNHEFDTGVADVAAILAPESNDAGAQWEGASFPYLSSNLNFAPSPDLGPLVTASGQLVSALAGKLTASVVIPVAGQNVGVVGVTTPTLEVISSPDPVEVLPANDDLDGLVAIIQSEVDALTATGIDKVILLSHMQQLAFERAFVERLRDVDIIVGGGSNTILADSTDRLRPGDSAADTYPVLGTSLSGEPVALVNTGGNYRYVGRLVVAFDDQGHLLPSTIDAAVSGAYATDEMGVQGLGNLLPNPRVASIASRVGEVLALRDGNTFGRTDVYLEGRRARVRTEETNLGNLTADANLWQAQQVDPKVLVSLKNGGGIRQDIGLVTFPPGSTDPEDLLFLPPPANPAADKEQGEVSQFDIENALAFNNTLTVLTVTASELVALLEHGVADAGPGVTSGRFPQVGGVRFSWDPMLPGGDRLQNAAIVDEDGTTLDVLVNDGELAGDPARAIRMVTLNFLAGGGDGYPFPDLALPSTNPVDLTMSGLADGLATFAAPGSEQDALAEYLAQNFDMQAFAMPEQPPSGDLRIQNLSQREDAVFRGVTFATFNVSLNRNNQGDLAAEFVDGSSAQGRQVAEIIQRIHPDVILLNEFDFDPNDPMLAVDRFRTNYLEVSQNGQVAVRYPYVFFAPSNTGVASGFDLNNDGTVGGADDAFGFGFHEGQFAMVLLSKFPIDAAAARTFQHFLWADMPGARLPIDPITSLPWYDNDELAALRLSSKSHWDVPVLLGGRVIHALTAHPTPPVFDGDEDRNGLRNADEIRFWSDYITPGAADYIYDDVGVFGGIGIGEEVVILGDYNADPFDGDSTDDAALQFTTNPLLNHSVIPSSAGGSDVALVQAGVNAGHVGDPAWDTADFGFDGAGNPDVEPGNLRVDYVLPSATLTILDAGVFWPESTDPLFPLVAFPLDHRAVFVVIE